MWRATIQEQDDVPAAPHPTNVSPMGSEGFSVPTSGQVETALSRADVQRAEQRGLVAVAADGDAGRIAHRRPTGSQRRRFRDDGRVAAQHHGAATPRESAF